MTRWTALTALSASLLLPTLACSGNVPASGGGEPEAVAVAAAPVAAAVTRAPILPKAHGKVRRVNEALGEVDLRPDQRAQLAALAADAEARQLVALAARKDLGTALAAQIGKGTLDRDALSAKVSAIALAMTDAEPKDRSAFEAVHAILDPDQRAQFVDAMESDAKSSHLLGAVMNLAAPSIHGRGMGGPMHQWAEDLKLSDEQRATFEQLLSEAHHEMKGSSHHGPRQGKMLLEAFRADTFSFDAVSPAEDIGAKAAAMTAHVLDVAEKVLPLLTDEQRGIAAQKITERAGELPFGPGM
jgi:Spy/CpxP family protein refolding chaperone